MHSANFPINNTDVPLDFVGAWRKHSTIERAFWLQTTRLHASLEIPLEREDFSLRGGWDDFSDRELLVLALQGGVSGACIAQGDILHRRRQIDYLPRRGDPYLRRLWREGEQLHDVGLDGRDPTLWERLADGHRDRVALRFQDAGLGSASEDQRRGYLLVIDDFFMYVRDRLVATPRADSLATLADCKGYGRAELLALLDFELSFGRREAGMPWRIECSTVPFREGKILMDDEIVRGIVARAGNAPERIRRGAASYLRYWSVDETSGPLTAP